LYRFLKKELKNSHLYPDQYYKELNRSIAAKLALTPDEVFPGNGSDEILDLFFKAFIQPNDRILIFEPSFSLYKILCEIYRARIIKIKLKNFQYSLGDILKNLKKNIKAVIICNPNNPTGTYINQKDLECLIKKLNTGQFLCIDEAYYQYAMASDFPDSLQLFKNYRKKANLIVTRTFSKIHSLAGLRIGYSFANKEIIKTLNKIRMPFNINLLADRAAQYCLKNDSVIKKFQTQNYKNKKYFYSELENLKLPYIPSEANFILIKTPISGKAVFDNLIRKGIIIRPFESPNLRYYIRVTIGTRTELKKLIKEFKLLFR